MKVNNMTFNQPWDSENVILNLKALQLKEILIKILWFAKSNQVMQMLIIICNKGVQAMRG